MAKYHIIYPEIRMEVFHAANHLQLLVLKTLTPLSHNRYREMKDQVAQVYKIRHSSYLLEVPRIAI